MLLTGVWALNEKPPAGNPPRACKDCNACCCCCCWDCITEVTDTGTAIATAKAAAAAANLNGINLKPLNMWRDNKSLWPEEQGLRMVFPQSIDRIDFLLIASDTLRFNCPKEGQLLGLNKHSVLDQVTNEH
jgi:hypothetical protein